MSVELSDVCVVDVEDHLTAFRNSELVGKSLAPPSYFVQHRSVIVSILTSFLTLGLFIGLLAHIEQLRYDSEHNDLVAKAKATASDLRAEYNLQAQASQAIPGFVHSLVAVSTMDIFPYYVDFALSLRPEVALAYLFAPDSIVTYQSSNRFSKAAILDEDLASLVERLNNTSLYEVYPLELSEIRNRLFSGDFFVPGESICHQEGNLLISLSPVFVQNVTNPLDAFPPTRPPADISVVKTARTRQPPDAFAPTSYGLDVNIVNATYIIWASGLPAFFADHGINWEIDYKNMGQTTWTTFASTGVEEGVNFQLFLIEEYGIEWRLRVQNYTWKPNVATVMIMIVSLLCSVSVYGVIYWAFKAYERNASLKESLEMLRIREQQLSSLAHHLPFHIGLVDADEKVACWNKASESMFGFSSSDVIGRVQRVGLYGEEVSEMIGMHVLNGEAFSGSFSLKRKSGEYFVARVKAFPLDDSHKTNRRPSSIAIVAEDLTEEIRLDRERERYEACLQRAEKVARMGSCVLEHKLTESTNETDEIIWSDGLYAVLGLIRASVVPTMEGFYDKVHPEDVILIKSNIQRVMCDGGKFAVEHRVMLPGNVVVHCISMGRCDIFLDTQKTVLVFTVQDITDRRAADAILRKEALARFLNKESSKRSTSSAGNSTPKNTKVFVEVYFHGDDNQHPPYTFMAKRSGTINSLSRRVAKHINYEQSRILLCDESGWELFPEDKIAEAVKVLDDKCVVNACIS